MAALDATPLIGTLSGIGRYVDELVAALPGAAREADVDLDLVLAAFTTRRSLAPHRPGATTRCRPVVMRAMHRVWARSELAPVEWLAGRCDVFHATNYVLPPVRRAAGIVNVHDLSFLRHPDTVDDAVLRFQQLVPRSIRRASLVLAISEAVAAEIRAEYGLEDARVRTIPLGVSRHWFEAVPPTRDDRRRLGLPERYLLFVGTQEPRKGLDWLGRADLLARRDHPDLPSLVIAGPAGWGEVGLPPGSVPLGYLASADLHAVMAGAQALVLPSRYEGFGLPVLEAMAAGVPVVASTDPALREVAGSLATHVPIGDDDALAEALVAAGAAAPDATAAAARRAWAARWTWERTARHTLAAYREVAG